MPWHTPSVAARASFFTATRFHKPAQGLLVPKQSLGKTATIKIFTLAAWPVIPPPLPRGRLCLPQRGSTNQPRVACTQATLGRTPTPPFYTLKGLHKGDHAAAATGRAITVSAPL